MHTLVINRDLSTFNGLVHNRQHRGLLARQGHGGIDSIFEKLSQFRCLCRGSDTLLQSQRRRGRRCRFGFGQHAACPGSWRSRGLCCTPWRLAFLRHPPFLLKTRFSEAFPRSLHRLPIRLGAQSCCTWGRGMERRPLSVKRLRYSTSTTSLSPTRSFLVSTPRITPCTRFGVATSTRSPRICQSRFPRPALSVRSIAKLFNVLVIGS